MKTEFRPELYDDYDIVVDSVDTEPEERVSFTEIERHISAVSSNRQPPGSTDRIPLVIPVSRETVISTNQEPKIAANQEPRIAANQKLDNGEVTSYHLDKGSGDSLTLIIKRKPLPLDVS